MDRGLARSELNIAMALTVALLNCGCASTNPAFTCEGYSDWQSSPYVLPYPPGISCMVVQGNCSPRHGDWTSHRGSGRYSYDFLMPIGSSVTAVRAGRVAFLEEGFADDDHGPNQANYVIITHGDGTVAVYGHLAHDGVLVNVGDRVAQGDIIAASGASGASAAPHLHLQVARKPNPDSTLPITFRNTSPNPRGLRRGKVYEARAYSGLVP